MLNSTAAAVSQGQLVCYHTRTAASATGIDLDNPVTSSLPAFAGVVYANGGSIAAGAYGLVQAYGYGTAYISCSGGETVAPGQVLGPVNAQSYANSSGTSTNLGPIICMSQRVGGNALNPVFIRAL